MEVEEVASLAPLVAELRAALLWDPAVGDGNGSDKHLFVEALTAVAALPQDSLSMEIRRLLVVSDDADDTATPPPHLLSVVAALDERDVLLKCKAASAVGALCVSRVAGQLLLDMLGELIVARVAKMATCRNQWAQGDAFSVLGWIVVIADESLLALVEPLVGSVVKSLRRNLTLVISAAAGDAELDDKTAALVASEQATNFRVYALVLLLNICQRDVAMLEPHAGGVVAALRDAFQVLLLAVDESSRLIDEIDPGEFGELLRLAVTLLSLLVDVQEVVRTTVLELKMVPLLLKVKQLMHDDRTIDVLGGIEEAECLAELLTGLVDAVLGVS